MCHFWTAPFRASCPRVALGDAQADHFEVHFHSDSSNVDWGARLMAYGIMQVSGFLQCLT